MTKGLLHGELTYYLRGTGFRIHNALKDGHAEQDYERALIWVLERDRVPYRQQPQYRIHYKRRQVGEYYPDLMLGDNKVLVELKAVPAIEPVHKAQTLSYLAVTGAELGLIMNFGASSMQFDRLPNFLSNRQPAPWQCMAASDIQPIAVSATRLFLVERCLLLATIAVTNVTHKQTERMRWAMKETGCPLGLIANFHSSLLDIHFLRTG